MRRFNAFVCFTLVFLNACGGGGGSSENSETSSTGPFLYQVENVIEDTNFPVGLAFAPDGRLFFSELATGKLRIIKDGELVPQPFADLPLPGVDAAGPLGMVVDPDFKKNHFLYVFQTVAQPFRNQIIRLKDNNGLGGEITIIFDNIPTGGHNGGKLVFDKSKHLLISGGDAGNPRSAQQATSLAGKLLRINRDGTIPSDNPMKDSAIYATGFRNIFGISIHPKTGSLYVSENGPDCDDEINKIEKNGNYGWGEMAVCGDTNPAYVQPLLRYNPTLGLTGLVFYRGDVFPEFANKLLLGDFNTGAIRLLEVDDSGLGKIISEKILYAGGVGSVIDLGVSTDGNVYFTTPIGVFRLNRADS